ncbi:MAG: hypothetical protein CSB32_01665 [Desulfobacterales bacterium]|nr:MAG: hypothetical protein CSB32_01665 [Desulfobacterales bacterium]
MRKKRKEKANLYRKFSARSDGRRIVHNNNSYIYFYLLRQNVFPLVVPWYTLFITGKIEAKVMISQHIQIGIKRKKRWQTPAGNRFLWRVYNISFLPYHQSLPPEP